MLNPAPKRAVSPPVVALLLLAACGGGGSGKTAAACGLITASDVQSVVGAATGPGSETKGVDGITTCQYAAPDGSHSILVRVSPKIGDREHAAFPFKSSEPVPGLGDDSKFAKEAVPVGEASAYDPGSALSVLKEKVEIAIYYTGKGDRLAISKTLAERALSKL